MGKKPDPETPAGAGELCREIVDLQREMICRFRPDTTLLFVNPAYARMFGSSPGKLVGQKFLELVPESERPGIIKYLAGFNRDNPEKSYHHEVILPGGGRGWQEWTDRAIFSADGRVVEFQSVGRDITESKRAEEELRESEEKYRTILERSFGMVYLHDQDGKILEVNEAAVLGTGYTREELLRMRVYDLHESEAGREDIIRLWKSWPVGQPVTLETRHRRRDGSLFPVEVTTGKVAVSGREYILATVRDITDRKRYEEERNRLEEQVRQKQKLETVGRLAGGVAHEFNNMLSVIIGFTELAMHKTGSDPRLREDLEEVHRAALRSADITRRLLAFARKQIVSPRTVDLNETVERSLKMLRRLIGEEVELAWRPAPDLPPVRLDPVQVDQVLANLCLNARDALEGPGRIAIETGRVSLADDDRPGDPEFVPGDYLTLSVSDNGLGMDRATREKIFEPFFTTKEVGEGSGLGLAVVYGIVRQNRGFIEAESAPREGTTFRIHLPRAPEAEDGGEPEPEAVEPARGGETILAVEDEPANLRLLERMLKSLGYNVLTAAGPDEALRRAGEHPGKIDLLLTDVIMPEMNGRDLADHLTTIYPKLKCLFISGYTAEVIGRHGVLEEGVHFLQKPILLKPLAAAVRKTLG